jgi:hypothetical protein
MSKSHKDIEKKKQELQANLVRLQAGLDKSIDEVKEDVSHSLSPKEIIKKHPLPTVGLSIVVGFLLGSSGSSKKEVKKVKYSDDDDVVSSISKSLKKRLTQKAVDVVLDLVEQKLSERNSTSDNG